MPRVLLFIPRQVLRRFTRRGDVVVDLFGGLGTTLIECRHLGRHGVAVELNPAVAARSRELIAEAANPHGVETPVLEGDSASPEAAAAVRSELERIAGRPHADCVILHPPYHDIIRFGEDPRDLSACADVAAFLAAFERVARNALELLAPGRFMALVVGDAYTDGEWVPLGFECMQLCRGLVHRRSHRLGPRPDKVAMWAVVMALFLILVTVASSHAAV